jgi:hypothetical protein
VFVAKNGTQLDEIMLMYNSGTTARFSLFPRSSHRLKTIISAFILAVLSAAHGINWSAVDLWCVFKKLVFIITQHITLWLHSLELRGFPLSYFTCSGYVCTMAFDTTLLVVFFKYATLSHTVFCRQLLTFSVQCMYEIDE